MDAKINQDQPAASEPLKLPQSPKKRVLFVITQSELGGAQQFLIRLLERLDKNRFECMVAAGTDGENSIAKLIPPGVSYRPISSLKRGPNIVDDIMSLFQLRRLFRQYAPDIIFLNSSKAGFNGSWAASALPDRLPNVKVIYRIGGWTFNDPRPRWQQLLYLLMEKFSASWKDYIVVNNKCDYDLAIKHRIKPRKELLLIHNGIDPYMPFLEPEEARIRLFEVISRQGIRHDRGGQAALLHTPFLIGVIANFYPAKGIEYFVKAMGKIRSDALAVIIGDGTGRQEIESRIAKLGLEKKIILAGTIEQAHKYLRAFDALVLPSVKEGFPWVVLEAMAAKIPVISTRVGAIPEVIESGQNGLIVEPANSQALADAIDKLAGNERMRAEMALRAHQDLIRRFDIRKMVESYERLLGAQ